MTTDYNFHTHTFRCRHSKAGDEELIQAAIKAGIKDFGFADHCPWPGIEESIVRMKPSELSEYANTLRALREKYKDQINIHIGLECEYFPDHFDWLLEEKEKNGIEYLLFGHHYWPQREEELCYQGRRMDDRRIGLYTETAIKALETGIFSYFAHPDLLMKGCADKHNPILKPVFRELCAAAKKYNTPIEFNLMGFVKGKILNENECDYKKAFENWLKAEFQYYPHPYFWQEAASMGMEAVIGADAHKTEHLSAYLYECAEYFLKELGIKIIKPNIG